MKPIGIDQVREIVSGAFITPEPALDLTIASIVTDTRLIQPGSLFVAIRGENHNGINFLPEASVKGAVAAIVEERPSALPAKLPLVLVSSSRKALGDLGRFARGKLSGAIIGVGGSNGKTGTKHLIDSVLAPCLQGSISPKSFNNDIGVPLAIFPADESQDYLVLEIGTNHPGEIRALANIALPDIAVITNVSAEHLEGLGDIDGVRKEEASLIEGLSPKGVLIVNGDDPQLLDAVGAYTGKRVTFGAKPTNDLYASDIVCSFDGVRFKLNGQRDVFVPLMGSHIAINSLAAIAVGRRLGLSDEQIIGNLKSAHGPDMRLELQRVRGMTVLNDAYNANPASMQAAIELLCSLPSAGRRVAILGDMRELGAASEHYHREAGVFLSHLPIGLLICVGEGGAMIADAAQTTGFRIDRVIWYKDSAAAAEAVPGLLSPGDLVLLKASRGMKFELIAQSLANGPALKAAS